MFLAVMQAASHIQTADQKLRISGHVTWNVTQSMDSSRNRRRNLQIPVSHTYHWYQLVHSVGKTKNSITNLTLQKFINFSSLLKVNLFFFQESKHYHWQDVKWFCYTQEEEEKILLKTSLQENKSLEKLSLLCQGTSHQKLETENLHTH
jgi:hypothetical protein